MNKIANFAIDRLGILDSAAAKGGGVAGLFPGTDMSKIYLTYAMQ